MSTGKKILILTKVKKGGVEMTEELYNLISSHILALIKQHGELKLTALIELSKLELSDKLKGDFGWYLLAVKQELELQGLIRTTFENRRTRTTTISLTRPRKATIGRRNYLTG